VAVAVAVTGLQYQTQTNQQQVVQALLSFVIHQAQQSQSALDLQVQQQLLVAIRSQQLLLAQET
jgi:hypothetical protein